MKIQKAITSIKGSSIHHARDERESYREDEFKAKEEAISRWYREGGDVFFEWTNENYRSHNGSKLIWSEPYLADVYRLVGNPWLERIIIEKPAQVGYTECLIALATFFIGYLRSPLGIGFEEHKKLLYMMGTRVQPAFSHCDRIQEISQIARSKLKRQDLDNRTVITIGGVELTSFFACNKTKEEASGNLRSFPACGILADEFSLWPPGLLDAAISRMGATQLPSQPVRAGSTPSYEHSVLGLEIEKSRYEFQWHVKCPYCDREQFLDPFGNLLKSEIFEENGVSRRLFISPRGTPFNWYHHVSKPKQDWDRDDFESAVSSAYVGCVDCEGELTKEDIRSGQFLCKRTGISIQDFCAQTTKNQKVIDEGVALRLPSLARMRFNPVKRIRRLFNSDNILNEIQQELGKAVSIAGGKIDLELLLGCANRPVPFPENRKPDLIVMGVDQGRPFYWEIQEWYFTNRDNKFTAFRDAFVRLVEWGEASGFSDIEQIAEKYAVDLIGVDSEPEYSNALQFSYEHLPKGVSLQRKNKKKLQVYACDEVHFKGDRYRRQEKVFASPKKSELRSLKTVLFSIDRTYFLDNVRDRIYSANFSISKTIYYDTSDRGNLPYHYITSERTEKGIWDRAEGKPDHYFHAHSFCNAAVYIALYEPGVGNAGISSIETW